MPDTILLTIFGILSAIGLCIGSVAVYLAMKNARKKEGEMMMVVWAFIALAGFTVAGMSCAYFVLPILANRYF